MKFNNLTIPLFPWPVCNRLLEPCPHGWQSSNYMTIFSTDMDNIYLPTRYIYWLHIPKYENSRI